MHDEGDEEWKIAACMGKTRFDSARLAKTVAKRRSHNGKKGEAYPCPFCRYWHIGQRKRLKRPEKDMSRAKAKERKHRRRKVHTVARAKVPEPQSAE